MLVFLHIKNLREIPTGHSYLGVLNGGGYEKLAISEQYELWVDITMHPIIKQWLSQKVTQPIRDRATVPQSFDFGMGKHQWLCPPNGLFEN